MTVYLVGAGPGDADLLTVRAARLISQADVVVHDRLIDQSVLNLIQPSAEKIDVGKQVGQSQTQSLINDLLVQLGRDSRCIVRLKGGDPFVFGRGGEEATALANSGIPFEVVPGLSSALSAPIVAGVPLTQRGYSQGILVISGHGQEDESPDFRMLAHARITLVILMGVSRRAEITRDLLLGGLEADTPVAAVEQAWTGCQRVVRGTLEELPDLKISSPAVIVIGVVAAFNLFENATRPDDVDARCLSW